MQWEGEKQHNYALVTMCFRDGDREHYDEVIFSKPTFVNNDHIKLLNMMYSGVSSDPVDYRSQGGSPYEEYWQDGMNAVSIYGVKYLTTTEYEVLSKFNVATFLGAESEEKKDWKGVSLAGSVDDIKDMLRAEGDPEWMTNKNLRRRLFLKSQKEGGVPKICEVCEDSESNLHYYQEDGEQFVVCRDCLQQSMDDWKTIFGRRPTWNAETFEGNFSGSMSGGITYDVSFTSSLPMDEDYDYDDDLIKDYVEELIRDDGSRKSVQEFDFVMDSGWYSGAHINGTVTWWTGNYSAETFEAPSYGNYYGACLLPDGSCTETSLEMCRALGGNFQGPGTSCYPDAGWARPRVMRAEGQSKGLGRGLTIGIVAGIISGLVTTVFGTVISEILLDRLREDPELEITDEEGTPSL